MKGQKGEDMITAIERILKVFADNNLFNEGVELIGSWCFQLYQRHLGAKSFPLRTQDIVVWPLNGMSPGGMSPLP